MPHRSSALRPWLQASTATIADDITMSASICTHTPGMAYALRICSAAGVEGRRSMPMLIANKATSMPTAMSAKSRGRRNARWKEEVTDIEILSLDIGHATGGMRTGQGYRMPACAGLTISIERANLFGPLVFQTSMHIYVINLARSVDRRLAMSEKLAGSKATVEFVDAVEGRAADRALYPMAHGLSDGEVGCYLSHVAVWRLLSKSSHESALVLEDDVVFNENLDDLCDTFSRLPFEVDLIRVSSLKKAKGMDAWRI
ncbi:MAG: glycosyltransferase family 25 protein, partial [Comamonadaceae bacterium]